MNANMLQVTTPQSRLPELIAAAGERASMRFPEFFAANIRNPHTRTAYFGHRRFCQQGGAACLLRAGHLPRGAQGASRLAHQRIVIAWGLRNRWFADSSLEGSGFEPSVPGTKEPVFVAEGPATCSHS